MTTTEIANAYIALTVKAPNITRDATRLLNGTDAAVFAKGKAWGNVLTGAIAGAAAAATGKAISLVMGSINGAIKRVDTLNNFPKIMANLGYSADDAKASIDKISKSLIGLPTTLDGMASAVQQLAPLTGSLGEATDLSLALNNALLAGGKSTEIQANAMEQYVQQLAVGKVDMTAWRSMVSAMPGQMDQLSKSLLGANAKQTDLYAAMQSGSVTFDQFNAAILALNKDGYSGFASFADQAKSATDGIATSQTNLQTAVTRALATIIQKFQPAIIATTGYITALVNSIGPFVISMIDGAKAVWDWVVANKGWITTLAAIAAPFAALIGAVTAARVVTTAWTAITYGAAGASYASGLALKIYTVAMTAQSLATKVAAGAQAAFNAVMNANPIVKVVTILSALVAGLVMFFTQTELGKAIWQEFTRFLGEAWANITGFFTAAWENVIQPVFKAIGDIAVWLWENVLSPVFDFIGKAVEFIAAGFKLQFDLIVNAFRLVGAIANWLWVNALQPVFQAIGDIVAWLWKNILEPYINGWAIIFQWLWETVLSPVFGFIGSAVDAIGKVFEWLYLNIVKPVWEGISKAITTAWKWINTNVFSPMKTGIDAVGKAFDAVGKFIGEVWTNIQNAAKAPVKFLINTVWNDGIRSFAVDVLKALGLNDIAKGLPRVRLPFADGGVLPGYTPGRDVHEFYSPTGGRLALSGGEAIMRPEFTRAVGGAAGVARLNAMARKGQAFKDGGVWGDIGSFAGDVWDNISGAASVAWDFITDPVGAVKKHMSGFISGLGGNGFFSDIVAGVPKMLTRGFESFFKSAAPKGAGTKGMGWEAMWNIIRSQVPGSVMTSNFRPGAKTVNGGQSYHALGRAIDIVPASMTTFNAIAKLFPNASELIYSPAGSRQLQNGRPFNGWSDAVRRQHYNHVHLAMANGGVVPKLYDQGGWLPDGGMAVNRSGKPEAVLTPAESSALRNGLGGMPSELVIVDVHGDLIGRMRVEAEQTLSRAVPSKTAVHALLAR